MTCCLFRPARTWMNRISTWSNNKTNCFARLIAHWFSKDNPVTEQEMVARQKSRTYFPNMEDIDDDPEIYCPMKESNIIISEDQRKRKLFRTESHPNTFTTFKPLLYPRLPKSASFAHMPKHPSFAQMPTNLDNLCNVPTESNPGPLVFETVPVDTKPATAQALQFLPPLPNAPEQEMQNIDKQMAELFYAANQLPPTRNVSFKEDMPSITEESKNPQN